MKTRGTTRFHTKATQATPGQPSAPDPGEAMDTRYPPGWHKPRDKKDERKMIEELVEHLYKDPEAQDDNAILRFLLLEWRDLKNNLSKNEPLARVKTRLLELANVRYIRLNESTNQHEYWRDHSTEGRRALQEHADSELDTTTVVDDEHPTGGVDKHPQDGMSPPAAHTTTPSEFRQMLNLLPEPTPTPTPTPTTPQKASPQNYSESDSYTSDYVLTEMLNPYTGKQVTVRATPPPATRHATLLPTELDDDMHKQDNDGFFIPVPPRKKTKKKSLDINFATHTHTPPHQPTTPHTVTRTSGVPHQYQTTDIWEAGVEETKEDFTEDFTENFTSNDVRTQEQELRDTTIATNTPDTTKDPETLVQALNTVLQYKIQEAVRTLDTHQKAWISMIGYREEHHRAKMRELEDKMRDYEETTPAGSQDIFRNYGPGSSDYFKTHHDPNHGTTVSERACHPIVDASGGSQDT